MGAGLNVSEYVEKDGVFFCAGEREWESFCVEKNDCELVK